ncbi:MAG: gliding motility-associated ABC transporter substrate-binding protein GldG [Flavobacterium sp. BFFFF1]|uniref:gliding motility-associated ABC transporter substrate-binding protein GldG n=1 Tax=Flavobacterium sp. BFFFF1 TaxID=2015557 RepID=UPI000BC8A57B|nr:gliding motility-associated ABC transporter substrate-binding protein GldG [Flavobacterium sp. BFFFF1]OYU79136.1 MAG: gliding motility-associated ABC transporter substrate-binding protein GldG [Flavobacterium sp. BFFFF1]
MKSNKSTPFKTLLFTIIILLLVNVAGFYLFKRFDLTADKRYTLSPATLNVIKDVKEPVYIYVFLTGEFPAQFKRLQTETRQMLEEFHAYNSNITFKFSDPMEDEATAEAYKQELTAKGFVPVNINQTIKGKKTLTQVFPWAKADLGEKSVAVPLLVNNFGSNSDDNINKSVQLLEFAFTDALTKLTSNTKKRLAVLKGNGEIKDKYMADFLRSAKEYYTLAEFNLDSLQNDPAKVLSNLRHFDATLIAKPTQPFSDNEKYILDQYIENGGKTMWLIDKVSIDLDSLQNDQQATLAFPLDLNLDDMFFKYGVRINNKLIQDLLSTPITVQSQNGEMPIDWLYSPIIKSEENHAINKNVNLVKLEFANQIDTLKNGIRKTVLLKSSAQSKPIGVPVRIGLADFTNVVDESAFKDGGQIIGTLLEGRFTSAFKNRVKPFTVADPVDDGKNNKMIVIADGDIINYKYVNKKPLINDIDPWTQQSYGNKDFLINAMNYLLDDNGLVDIRNKNIELQLLDDKKVEKEYTKTQFLTIGAPLLFLLVFGLVYGWLRKRRYAR